MDALFEAKDQRLDHFLSSLNANCQLIGSSRTFSDEVLTKFSQFSKNLKCIDLIEKETAYFGTLLQFRVNATGEDAKIRAMMPIIQSNARSRSLIFVSDSASCKAVYNMLQVRQVNAFPLASDMTFDQRERSLTRFMDSSQKRSMKAVLIVEGQLLAGYLMKHVWLVINYDLKLSEPNGYLLREPDRLENGQPR